MLLIDYIPNQDLLARHIEAKYVQETFHKNGRLGLLGYTDECTKDWLWDEVTTKVRGVIYDRETGEIIARPYEKFFEINTQALPETLVENLPSEKPDITEKLDGVMGTLYQWGGSWHVASRHSFHSPIAVWASTLVKDKDFQFPKDYTPVVEILWSKHRILCTYPFDDIVVTGFIHRDTGEQLPWGQAADWAGHNALRIVHTMDISDPKALLEKDVIGEEGYVITYPMDNISPLKLKVKMASYKLLSRKVKQLTPTRIWQHMSEGGDTASLFDARLPRELSDHVAWWVQHFRFLVASLDQDVALQLVMAPGILRDALRKPISEINREERKAIAAYFEEKTPRLKGLLWAKLMSKNYHDALWEAVYPPPGSAIWHRGTNT